MLQGEPQKRRSSVLKFLLIVLLPTFVVIVALPFIKPVTLEFGESTLTIAAGFLSPRQAFYDEHSGFISEGWDGPTGEFTHGSIHGLKLGSWLYRVDSMNDPVGAARRRLPTSVTALIQALDSPRYWTRCTAAQELAHRGYEAKGALPFLIRRCANEPNSPISGPLQELCTSVGPEAAQALADALAASNSSARETFFSILQDMGPDAKAASPALEKHLQASDPVLSLGAAYTLWKIDHSAQLILPPVMRLLTNGSPQVRAGASASLGEMGLEAAPALLLLTALLEDQDKDVRSMSARTLGLIGPAARSAIPPLIERLKTAQGDEQMWVIQALGNFGPEARGAIPILAELARGHADGVGRWSVEALANMGPEAVPALVKAFNDDQYPKRSFAAKGLCKIGCEATNAVPAMIEALRSNKAGEVVQAAKVLGCIGPGAREALPPLRALLDDGEPRVRVQAAGAIWRIGETNDSLMQVLIAGVKEERTRHTAIVALGDIGPAAKAAKPVLFEALSDRITSITWDASNALQRIDGVAKIEQPIE